MNINPGHESSELRPEEPGSMFVASADIEPPDRKPQALIIIAVLLIICAGLLALIPRDAFLARLEQDDRHSAGRAVDIVRVALENETAGVARMNLDWSVWDDTYQYVQGAYPGYVEANLSNQETNQAAGIDLVAIYDAQQQLLCYENMDSTKVISPQAFDLVLAREEGAPTEGLYIAGGVPLFISYQPIYPTSGEGEPAGTLLMARYLDQEWIDQLRERQGIEMAIIGTQYDLAGSLQPAQIDAISTAGFVMEDPDQELARLYFTVPDVDNQPILMAFDWSRDIVASGRQLADYAYFLFAMAVLLVAGGLTAIFIVFTVQMRRGKKELARALAERSRELAERERQHRIIFDNSPVGIAHIDAGGIVLDANPAMHRILGLPEGSYNGANLHDIYRGREIDELIRTCTFGINLIKDLPYYRPSDERSIFLNIILHPMDTDELPTDILIMVSDITERKQDEEKLHQLRSAVESSPVSVLIIGRNQLIEYVNKYYTEMSGYSVDETRGFSLATLGERTESTAAYEDLRATFMAGNAWRGEFRNRRKNGEMYWERVILAPITDAHGELTHFVAITEDFTERKHTRELEAFLAGLERSPLESSGQQIWQATLAQAMAWTDSPLGFVVAQNGPENITLGLKRDGSGNRVEAMSPGQITDMCARLEQCVSLMGDRAVVIFNGELGLEGFGSLAGALPLSRQMWLVTQASPHSRGLIILADKAHDYSEIDDHIATRLAEGFRSILLRRRAEQKLRASQKGVEALLQAVNTGIVVIDPSSRKIAYVNPAALDMFGGDEQDLLGRVCHDFLCPSRFNSCPILDLNQEVDKSERTLLQKDGGRLTILKTVVPLSFGGKQFLLESFMDLSEIKTIEKELQLAKENAEIASRTKSLFLANMSHEIRTPMNAILGYSQLMMRDQELTPGQMSHLDVISRSGEHLLQLINEILEMSRIESGQLEFRAAPSNFPRLLEDVASMFGLLASEKGLNLAVQVSDLLPPVLVIDEGKVRQILVNLLGNATKFTEKGGSIRLKCELMPSDLLSHELVNLRIEVEDTGHGISASERERVFESFSQGESGQLKGGGTGLGLSISREFARVMGGELFLKYSEPGRGSCFVFTLSALIGETSGSGGPLQQLQRVDAIADISREWCALVVDDHETNRGFLADLLVDVGYQVKEAADGRECLDVLAAWHPDIVLMDLMMPNMNGFDAIEAIRQSEQTADLPILAISASVMRDDGQRALQAGANAFLRKPYLDGDLLESIRHLTGVEYKYAAPPAPAGRAKTGADRAASLKAVSRLPADLTASMRQAVGEGDIVRLVALIESLPPDEASTTELLRNMAERFDYEGLLKALGEDV